MLILGLAGCGNLLRDKQIASDAMDQFHDRFSAGDYDTIYDTADPDFQKANVRADFLKFLENAHRQLGNYRHCASQTWSTNTFNGDTTVDLKYLTTFEQGDGTETFRFHMTGSRAALRQYHLSSSKLGDF